MRSILLSRRLKNRRPYLPRVGAELLEARQLLAAQIISPIPATLANVTSPAANSMDLENFLSDPNIPGTVAEMEFLEGSQTVTVDVALTDSATPITVQNFLSYANSGAYNGTILHRNAVLSSGGNGSPSTPAEIIQGGGFFLNENDPNGASIDPISTNAPITNEWNQNELNVAGAIAMARTTDPNSATSQWFFDVTKNSSLDDVADSNQYAVFGHVIGTGMSVIDSLAALPTFQLDIPTAGGSASPVPVTGITETEAQNPNTAIRPQNLIYLDKVTTTPGMSYTVTSNDPGLVKPTITGTTLSFAYGTGSGTADIEVIGTSFDGSKIAQDFDVTVPDKTQPSQGPTANNYSPPDVLTGTETTLTPLIVDTDSLLALDGGTLTIKTNPTNGTASVNSSNGTIFYTSNAGYTGPDSLTYTISDGSQTSAPATATITLNVVPLPVHVTVGNGVGLSYTEPDGTAVHLSVGGGTALVTFSTFDVQTSTSHGVITASGSGATIASIAFTNSSHSSASLKISAKGGTDGMATVGSITDTSPLTSIIAPNVEVTGILNAPSASLIQLGSTDGATISFFDTRPANLTIPTVINTSINAAGQGIGTIHSTSWSDTDGGVYTINSPFIVSLLNTGDFDENLNLTNNGLGIASAKIGGQISGGSWTITGLVRTLTAKSAASAWSMTTNNLVTAMHFGGNLSGSISTGAIGSLSVAGNLSGATIETRANFTKGFVQLKSLNVSGGISNSLIVAQGNVGSISAASITSSQIDVGLDTTDVQDKLLPTAASELTAGATLASVKLGSASPAFTDSKISADIIGSLRLGIINTANNSSAEGVAAKTISSLAATLSSGGSLNLGKTQLKSAAILAAYIKAQKINLGDFQIDLLS